MPFLDVRDLEPPQPMIKIAKALEELEEGETLEVLGSRPFTHLLPRLEELGYSYELTETPEGYLLRIWKGERKETVEERTEEFVVDENTNVGKLIDRYPQTKDILIKYGFTPLKNPLLRKILPYTVNLRQAKKIKRMSDEEFNRMLEEIRRVVRGND